MQRERNQGLYTADQRLESNGGATSTRQNPNGNGRRRGQARHGLECPEDGSLSILLEAFKGFLKLIKGD